MRRLRPVLLLLGVAVLAYGLLIPQLGFYWDELPMSWIRYELGPAAMTRYFSTNRPVWGMLYQITTRLLPQVPIYWEIFGLMWRWGTAVLVWLIVREVWKGRERLAMTAGLLFLLYPGFSQQWTSYLYSHFFIVLCFLLLSFHLMMRSLRYDRRSTRYWALTGGALVLSALNLWMMEYFFVLELLRPFLILCFLTYQGEGESLAARVRRTALVWAPYLAVFISNVLWRSFVFNNQIYQPTLLSKLRAAPAAASWELLNTIAVDLYRVSLGAWLQVFQFPNPASEGLRSTLFYAGVVGCVGLVTALLAFRNLADDPAHLDRMWVIGLGLIAMLFAGGPFWLTGLEVSLAHPANRFTLPFMLGVSLLFAGALEYVPARAYLPAVIALVALAAGWQALWSEVYRRDWSTQRALFWQMLWRAPGIKPDTTVLLNEGPLQLYADNSLTGALNWIYDAGNRSGAMDYALFYPTSRIGGTLQDLSKGQTITYDFISEVFHGNTSQTLAFYYSPPGCVRLLDPGIDSQNRLIPEDSMMREAALLSSPQWITPSEAAHMPAIYEPEPAHGWCYYFERADLAAQLGDWQGVVKLGDQAFQLNDYPNDPVERFPFIEGYAATGNWAKAQELAMQSYRVSPKYVGPLLCTLIQRMDRELEANSAKESGLNELRTKFSCLP
ncbi:MAG TPA: hypothetical protein VMJ64_08375 [Anaerolineales bacterium]|nr:hypothetical protein [Anaerolineales bacterium]